MSEIGVTQAREQLGNLVNRVEFANERVILTRNGRAAAALIPIDVLRDLEAIEDAEDLVAAQKAAREYGNVSHRDVLDDFVDDEIQAAARHRA